jgi:SAM-dependent methyltransferase
VGDGKAGRAGYHLELNHLMQALGMLQRTAARRVETTLCEFYEYDMALMRPWLPEKAETVLDVGAGIGAIDARLNEIYPEAHFYLLDRTGLDVEYGQHAEHIYYNSQEAARQLLSWNGVDLERVHMIDATDDYAVPVKEVDLVLSIFSWGWHYPVGTYAEAVGEATKAGGTLIMDVRNWEGKDVLKRYFRELARIEMFSAHRCVYRRRG